LSNVTTSIINAANSILCHGWVQGDGNKTVSVGSPAFGAERPRDTSRFTILAALQRAAGFRKFSTNKGGWYVKNNYEGFANRKALDALALDFAAKNPQLFKAGPVLGIETLNNYATSASVINRFMTYLAGRVSATGAVNTSGIVVKRA
jgi:hypothetical protein